MSTLIRARWVLPIAAPPIEDGAVRVERGRIVAVDRWAALRGGAGARVEECGDGALLPGFVNAHTHLEQTRLAGAIAPGPFWEWLERVKALRQPAIDANEPDGSARAGALQSVAAGVTCVGDISRTGRNVAALRGVPIRKVCFVELISGASNPPGSPAQLAERLDELAGQADELTRLGVTPHSLYNVTPDDLAAAVALARRRGLPLTMHVAETREEVAWLRAGGGAVAEFLARHGLPNAAATGGDDFSARLERADVARPPALLAHVNYCSDEQIAWLARRGVSVVYCPRAAAYFGHVGHRWREMLAAGVNVCLGTDGRGCTPSLSLLDELLALRRGTGIEAADSARLLRMATLAGANALGVEAECGSIETGKSADLISLDGVTVADGGAIRMSDATQIREVWLRGERLVHNGICASLE